MSIAQNVNTAERLCKVQVTCNVKQKKGDSDMCMPRKLKNVQKGLTLGKNPMK